MQITAWRSTETHIWHVNFTSASGTPFTSSDFLHMHIHLCFKSPSMNGHLRVPKKWCYTLMCCISFKIHHIFMRPNGLPHPGIWCEVIFGVFLVLLSCFSAPLGFPELCVLWGRFTSASNCLSHADFKNSCIKAAAIEEWPELPTGSCYFCRLDL